MKHTPDFKTQINELQSEIVDRSDDLLSKAQSIWSKATPNQRKNVIIVAGISAIIGLTAIIWRAAAPTQDQPHDFETPYDQED